MGNDRRQHTTELIKAAAIREFTTVGPRALSLSSIAKHAYISVGAVYERWSSREACIADLVANELPKQTASIASRWRETDVELSEIIRSDLRDPEQLERARFVVEAIFAARDERSLVPHVRAALGTLEVEIARRIPGSDNTPAIVWWLMCTWAGVALLRTSGCSVPSTFDDHVEQILSSVATMQAMPTMGQSAPRQDIDHPLPERVPLPVDSTTAALVDATNLLLSQRRVGDTNIRSVAREAGVTTGAVYRRFSSRSELMIRAFIAGLDPERYAWTPEFLTTLDAGGLASVGAFWATLCRRIWEDAASSNLLLEFTVAAHTDEKVRTSVINEIATVAGNREFFYSSLIAAGIVRPMFQADALAWTLQIPPIGMRLLASIDLVPTNEELEALLTRYLYFLIEPN